ncbi:MAG: cell division protein FtsL [Pseudomonadota bacterium]
MRGLANCLAACAVIALGYWAYHQNIQTKSTIAEVERLQRQIGVARERLAVLQDEWAYLTRPDRLRALAELDFSRLQLVQMTPEHFADATQIAYPLSPEQLAARAAAELLQDSASGPEGAE